MADAAGGVLASYLTLLGFFYFTLVLYWPGPTGSTWTWAASSVALRRRGVSIAVIMHRCWRCL